MPEVWQQKSDPSARSHSRCDVQEKLDHRRSIRAMETLPAVRLYGKRGSPQAYAIRDFLQRSDVPFEWIELANHEQARAELGLESVDDSRLPVCIFPDGTRMERPTVRQVTEKLGWFRHPSRSEYDVAIYGAGPAGLSASVYAASEGLKTVLVERFAVGGQASTSPRIENYLGFPEGISGGRTCRAGTRAGYEVRGRDSHSARRCPWRVHAFQRRCRPR